MLSFDLNFVPFDLTNCYKVYEDAYNNGWTTKEDLQNDVRLGLLPATEYKKIVGESYAKKAKKSTK